MRTQFGHPPPPLFVCLIVRKDGVTRTACAKMGEGVNKKVEGELLQHRPHIHFPDADTMR